MKALVGNKALVDVVKTRVAPEDQWTHYYKKDKAAEQLDYILLSKRVAENNLDAIPSIERRGFGTDIDYYEGSRFAAVTGTQGASDHCVVFIDLTV